MLSVIRKTYNQNWNIDKAHIHSPTHLPIYKSMTHPSEDQHVLVKEGNV